MKTSARVNTTLACTQWLTLRWTRGSRYYRAHLEQDLWRDWVITQVNGRRGSRLGCARTHPQPSLAAALTNLAAMRKPGGIRITEEQELIMLRRRLAEYPEAAHAVVQAAHAMPKPVTAVTAHEVEAWANPSA